MSNKNLTCDIMICDNDKNEVLQENIDELTCSFCNILEVNGDVVTRRCNQQQLSRQHSSNDLAQQRDLKAKMYVKNYLRSADFSMLRDAGVEHCGPEVQLLQPNPNDAAEKYVSNLAYKCLNICRTPYDYRPDVAEELEDPYYLEQIQKNDTDYEDLVYPVPDYAAHSYRMLEQHSAIHWTAHEVDPRMDRDAFAKLPKFEQQLAFKCFAILMNGDSIILDALESSQHSPLRTIRARAIQAAFTDQASRENVHQDRYSCTLELESDSQMLRYYRSRQFRQHYLGHFEELPNSYGPVRLEEMLYFMMLCENLLFSPLFGMILYFLGTGCMPKVCEITDMVMRDENIHYQHLRGLLSQLRRRLHRAWALDVLDNFANCVRVMLRKMFTDSYDPHTKVYSIKKSALKYETADKLYSYDIAVRHFDYVLYHFKLDNDLFRSREEYEHLSDLNKQSPCSFFADIPQYEARVNLMESTSTIYTADERLNVNFDAPNQYVAAAASPPLSPTATSER